MGCSKKMSIKIPTTNRCNEMITDIEKSLSDKFKTKAKYKGELRKLLIKTIKDNPTHFWEVTNSGLIHYEI